MISTGDVCVCVVSVQADKNDRRIAEQCVGRQTVTKNVIVALLQQECTDADSKSTDQTVDQSNCVSNFRTTREQSRFERVHG